MGKAEESLKLLQIQKSRLHRWLLIVFLALSGTRLGCLWALTYHWLTPQQVDVATLVGCGVALTIAIPLAIKLSEIEAQMKAIVEARSSAVQVGELETNIFRIPTKTPLRFLLLLCIVLAVFMTYCALYAPPHDKSQWPYLIILLLLSYCSPAFFVWSFRVCDTFLEVTETHIIQHAPGKAPLAVAWPEISDITAYKGYLEKQLVLTSNVKSVRIAIECMTENYDVLRQLIVEKTGKEVTIVLA